ncbi:hydroxyacid dehydrogenase [Rariglobus hedericola]|uniref:Hydroxyacid dehydrogenase n=1 Tax=Rariglobus hedericola TaxID=2597822 RepID=A0A556QLI1_9BACT|nr:hydroxyacid dehydrogenase [Rariglobus hedericola]TSJ77462.1 hydroxyacid dehydrogenase [Rariglobus hedericola]
MPKGLILLESHAYELIYGETLRAKISRRVDLVPGLHTKESIQANPSLLADVEVIFTGWGAPEMNAEFLAAAPKLRAVFYGAGSIKAMTPDAFWERNIAVTSAYAMNAVPVSEFTLASILLSLKRTWYYALETKRLGAYPEKVKPPGAYGTKVGLISFGMIGRLVRERLLPFNLDVWVYDPFLTPEQAAEFNVTLVSLDDIFRHCDVVSLHTPWLKQTEGMIQGKHFELMKSGATFLNTARGAIVNEPEMIQVLARRPEVTALLDVTWPEPPVPGSPLYSLPNVVLTPHIAGSQETECRRMGQLMVDEFDRWAKGEPMRWAISKDKAAILA